MAKVGDIKIGDGQPHGSCIQPGSYAHHTEAQRLVGSLRLSSPLISTLSSASFFVQAQ